MIKMLHNSNYLLRSALLVVVLIVISLLIPIQKIQAQIYEPEGLNMPGAWNGWTNPPANNLALASFTQVTNGRLTKITTGTTRWQTIFSVAASGADVVGGTYNWLFTSGPNANAFQNKWAGVTVAMNTLQDYTFNSGADNSITVVNGKWYTMNWQDQGYAASKAVFMETSAAPVSIATVSTPSAPSENAPVTINITTSAAPCAEEKIYLRYTTDSWATSATVLATMTGTTGTASIPGQPAGTTVSYYVLSSTIGSLASDYDMLTIKLNNNSGTNYSYSIAVIPEISWANLQFPETGEITLGDPFAVYGQVLVNGVTGTGTASADLHAWIGYSTENTDPATWTNWVSADFNTSFGNNDEYTGDIGMAIATPGTYYYATRFQWQTDAYVYGGYNGGYWDGTDNVSGVLTVNEEVIGPDFDWVNLQFPGSGSITLGDNYEVYAQAYIEGETGGETPASGVQAWIGYSTDNSDPSTWTNWISAGYFGAVSNNDEYMANIGTSISSIGTYYYASRFQRNGGDYFYGGYAATGGGIWDGTTNVSGELTVNEEIIDPDFGWVNLQFPDTANIIVGDALDVYAQDYIEGETGQGTPAEGVQVWIGYSILNTNPSTWTHWVPANYNTAVGNNDEYMANIGSSLTTPGTYWFASRFQRNSGDYYYGGYSESGGGFWNGTEYISGFVTVNNPAMPYPVTFTIIDATELHDNIKFKGEMTNWEPVDMIPDGHTWRLTMDVFPGTYQWGAIEADGSPDGIWLIEGPNLEVTVDNMGNITGTTTYTTHVTAIDALEKSYEVYPNPASDFILLKTSILTGMLRIVDINGKLVKEQIIAGGNTKVDIRNLAEGTYLICVQTDTEMKQIKLIKK
jgi:hypothetical protein